MNPAGAGRDDAYVGDVAYPDHFHRELMPAWLHATAIALGHAPPDIARPYRWCELGCAGGLSALVAAACNPLGHFTAIDVDPAQVERARKTAQACAIDNVEFIAADLREAANADDDALPFDFIVLHGLWAWVGDDVREAVLSIVRRRLAPGGLVQVGYMSHPGASQMQAVHKLMREAAQRAEGDSGRRAVAALDLLQDLADRGAGYFAEHPGAHRQLEAMRHASPEYLAHEFLGATWQPQHSADVIRALAGAGCAFLGSATPIENVDALSVPASLQSMLRGIPPGPLAETVRDLVRNQSLRRDLFQRDARPLDAGAHLAALDALSFLALPGAPASIAADLRLDTRIGPVEVPRAWVDPVLRALAAGPQGFARLRRQPPFDTAPGLLNQVLQALLWAGLVHPARSDRATPAVRDASRALSQDVPVQLVPDAGTAILASRT